MAATAIDCWKVPELECDEDSSPRPSLLRRGAVEGRLFASRYRVQSRIAKGGQGCIWLAIDEARGADARRVALKVIGPTFAREDIVRARFQRETEISASLVGPHFVKVHECGSHQGDAYMVMEHLEGEDLHALLKRNRRLTIQETRRIVREISNGLEIAHRAGVIHRDLKPRNIFLQRTEREPCVVKLLDFGVAKGAGDWKCTETGVLVGSPHYMSPEQARAGDDVDQRSDLWSLAATAYRCLTGTTPYEGDMYAVIVQLAKSAPRPPSRIVPSLPAAIDDFFARAFARDPAARFQSARELADELERATEGAPLAREDGSNEAGPQSVRSPLASLTGETVVAALDEMSAPVQEHSYLIGPPDPTIEHRPKLDSDGTPLYGPDRVSFDEVEARPSFFEAMEDVAADANGATTLDGGPVYRIFASCSQFPGADDGEQPPSSSSSTVEMRLGGRSPWSVYVDRQSLPSPARTAELTTRRWPIASHRTSLVLCLIVLALIALAWSAPWQG